MASKSIADRYFRRLAHPFDSKQVLGKGGGADLNVVMFRSRFIGQPVGTYEPRPAPKETTMKTLLIATALVLTLAAPAMAETFSNPYASTLGR